MVNSKKISVLMSTYNEPVEWISQTLDSIITQTYMPYEVIIVIDNPNNAKLVGYLMERSKNNSIFHVYINDINLGLVKSLNRGIEYCTGDYIARIDADDIALADRFKIQVEYMGLKGVDIVGSGYYVFYDETVSSTVEGIENSKSCEKILNYCSILAHPTWLMKKEVAKSLGGYRDIDSCEDLDFLQRAVRAGYTIANVKEPLLKYRDNPESISHKKRVRQLLTRDYLCKYYRKNQISSYDDYTNYLESPKYKNDYAKLELFDEIYKKHHNNLSIELIKNGGLSYYIRLKVKNAYINWWRNR